MRIDRLLCCLRFVKTRSLASALIDQGQLRCNGVRVTQASQRVAIGAVLTVPVGRAVRVIRIEELPEKRGSPAVARNHYTVLDPMGESDLAPRSLTDSKGTAPS